MEMHRALQRVELKDSGCGPAPGYAQQATAIFAAQRRVGDPAHQYDKDGERFGQQPRVELEAAQRMAAKMPPSCLAPRQPCIKIESIEPPEIGGRRVQVAHQPDIAVAQFLAADALRNNVGAERAETSGVAGMVESAFAIEPLVERGPWD